MNEAETRAEHIDPALAAAGWGVAEGSRIRREYRITPGRIEGNGRRGKPLIADYVLVHRNHMLGVVEAKAWDEEASEGVAQAKDYAGKMAVRFAYSTNGRGIYGIDMETGAEGPLAQFPPPDELWNRTFAKANAWRDRFAAVPFPDKSGSWQIRYYQEIAVNRVLEKIALGAKRILLTLATGTGKTSIAFQIAWKLFQARWNLAGEPTRRPRILFLTDRNNLADQARNDFSSFAAFEDNALLRVEPDEIRKKGRVPTNASVFFTIFQTFMTGLPPPVVPAQAGTQSHGYQRLPPVQARGRHWVPASAGTTNITSEGNPSVIPAKAGTQSHSSERLPWAPASAGTTNITSEGNPSVIPAQAGTQSHSSERLPLGPRVRGDDDEGAGTTKEGVTAEGGRPYFGDYPPDFFDFIVIDECHRGGANDESTWRGILEYFAPAVQLGLTATPKRQDNIDTYAYFGEPVYVYSLKEGINDGFLTPFKVKQISTTLDDYVYTPDDTIVEGEIEQGRRYTEKDFNKIIEIKEREAHRVGLFMDEIDQSEKTIVFCATQLHALAVRDLVNQVKKSRDPNYCVRVTADEGGLGEQHLRDFQDNEKTIPTILTTSQKLSTGVDARNIRNIVLMRPINSMIEFKQIIGRGTRLYDGKDYFTIWDFVKAHHHFSDPEWDGEPAQTVEGEPEPREPAPPPKGFSEPPADGPEPPPRPQKIKVTLADGKERTIQHMMMTSFWDPDGTPISAQQFMEKLFGTLPEFFKDEAELRALWGDPDTRARLLQCLAERGFGREQLVEMQRIIDAENSDLFDVLAYIGYALPPLTREERAAKATIEITAYFTDKQQAFLDFVLSHYVRVGVEELDREKLRPLLLLKYHNAIADAVADLGRPEEIGSIFAGFQKYLYQPAA